MGKDNLEVISEPEKDIFCEREIDILKSTFPRKGSLQKRETSAKRVQIMDQPKEICYRPFSTPARFHSQQKHLDIISSKESQLLDIELLELTNKTFKHIDTSDLGDIENDSKGIPHRIPLTMQDVYNDKTVKLAVPVERGVRTWSQFKT
ncbi:hypothetical protein HK096_005489 [Nowakowskiella sp. JEL0078]|nr:hypothetical protein HK096_005489 [Nowakowskiella sp. JEL0078]